MSGYTVVPAEEPVVLHRCEVRSWGLEVGVDEKRWAELDACGKPAKLYRFSNGFGYWVCDEHMAASWAGAVPVRGDEE